MNIRTPLYNEAGDGGNGGGGTILAGESGATSTAQAAITETPSTAATTQQQSAGWDFRSALADDGSFKPDWTQSLPADLKDYAASLGKYPNVTEFLRGFGNAQKLIGQRGGQQIKPPAPDAKPEEIAAWNKLIGVPEKPEDYGLKKPEKLPEGVEWDDANAAEFAAFAHKNGLNAQQVQALMQYDMERQSKGYGKSTAELTAFVEKQRAELQSKWGTQYGENVARAMKAAELLGLDPADPEIGNSAKVIQALHQASQLMQEDKFVASNKVGLGLTGPQQAEDIRRNPANPWHAAYMGKEGKARQLEAQAIMARLQGVKLTA